MRGSTSAPFPGMSVHLQVCPAFLWSTASSSWFSALRAHLSCQLVREGGQEYNARQDIGGGSGIRLLIRFWEVGRSKRHPGSYHSKYSTGVDVWSVLKIHLSVTFIFCGKKYFSVFCMPLLTLQPSLAEDLKCTGLGSVRIPLTQIRGFSPQLEGQLRSLHCNIEKNLFKQCKTYHPMYLQGFCLLKVPLPENYS